MTTFPRTVPENTSIREDAPPFAFSTPFSYSLVFKLNLAYRLKTSNLSLPS
nr:MAG TPA: hypothetical protein [Caudoviricetes sp.]